MRSFQQQLSSILEDSAASMRDNCPAGSAMDRRKWWRSRMQLDLRMAALINSLDTELLGSWKYVAIARPSS